MVFQRCCSTASAVTAVCEDAHLNFQLLSIYLLVLVLPLCDAPYRGEVALRPPLNCCYLVN